ncbi:hypothetical protein [Delftia acidovorans]|uniref:hypothetical protein n=1 Tax=Delftia acidovorans TaxID=80866 RepID=UPI003D10A54E
MTAINIQPVAEICSASHDDAQFGERAIKPLCDISGFEYGTPLYAGAAPAAAEHMQLTEEQWYDLASRHATVDWNGNGFLNAVKTLCADFAGIANRQSAAAAPALEAPAVDDELLELAQAIVKFNREHGSVLAVHIDNLADLVDERAAQAKEGGAAC